jgi:hypothetical protein
MSHDVESAGTGLTRARFRAGWQCLKRLYLEHRDAVDAGSPGVDRLRRFAAAQRVNELARPLVPGGTAIEDGLDHASAVARTRALAADPGVPAIYGGAFERDGVRIRVGALARRPDSRFDLTEWTAATRVREDHLRTAALQLWVLAGSGIAVERARVSYLNRDYVHPGGAIDPARLLVVEDVTDGALERIAEVERRIGAMRETLRLPEAPPIATGGQCVRPRCPFYGHCHAHGPEHPLAELPRIDPAQIEALRALGVTDARDVPDDFPTLTPIQLRARDVLRSGRPFVDPRVREALAAVVRPAHFVDFETFSTAIPVLPGARAYENVPFQWSDHVLEPDGAVEHRAFLHAHDSDPRRPFAESLLAATAGAASVVVYSSFEADVLDALAAALPDLAADLRALRRRIVDLLPIVREHCYHPGFGGSFSLKMVLPALVPALGYDDLAIRDGLTASASYEDLIDPATPPARRAEIREHLLAYCERDTDAMLALYRTLWDAR